MPFRPFLSRLVLLTALLPVAATATPLPVIPGAPDLPARNYVLMDPVSGQVLAARAADQAVAPASITKLMTAYLTFDALSRGSLKLGQTVPISVEAWKAGGSTMFLQPRLPVTVEQLIQGLVVVSGNDAAVALAEAVAGNTSSFVQMMNATARGLGMSDSHFLNVDGLPMPGHVVSARDIGILTEAIIRRFPQYLHYFGEKTFTYNHITQRNWNPLVFSDPTVQGMKTGHTDEAGYCLDATAMRQGRRLIAVVLGAGTRKQSADAAEALLDYGYRFFTTRRVYTAGQQLDTIHNTYAASYTIPVGVAHDVWVTLPSGRSVQSSVVFNSQPALPLARGQAIGTLVLRSGGTELTRVPLVALQPVARAGIFRHWINLAKARL